MRSPLASAFAGPHRLMALFGLAVVGVTSLVGSGLNPLAIPFALWAALPYGLLWFGGARLGACASVGAGAAALGVEVGIRAAVFIWPAGSTAAIALVFSPLLVLVAAMPAGAIVGWLTGKVWSWNRFVAVPLVVIDLVALGLVVLGLARPELFPTTVARREALIERVGPPRIVTGGDAFQWTRVTEKSAWYQAAELDGQSGDELAIVDGRIAEIVDVASLQTKERVVFTDGQERAWGSFSQLVRLVDGRFVVAQTGGGFSRTRVQGLDGGQLWELGAGAKLPPTSLVPADLDGDGRVEFYGAMTGDVVRVDADGREVWRRPAAMASIVGVLPGSKTTPAWIVGAEYGRRAVVWSSDGKVIGERAATRDEPAPMAVVDSHAGRALVFGGRSARGYDLTGAQLFDVPLGDFTLAQALSVQLAAGEPPSLVLVGATDRYAERWRLFIVSAGPVTRFDEILDTFPRLVVAKGGGGQADTLFVGGRDGLRVLRPK